MVPELPVCPFCDDAEGACEHTIGIAYDEPNDCLSEFAEWEALDDAARHLDAKVPGAREALDTLAGREKTWWMLPRGEGAGESRRMVHPKEVARRSKFLFISNADDVRGAPCALFSPEGAPARERFTGALTRCVEELKRLGAHLGDEPESDEERPPARSR